MLGSNFGSDQRTDLNAKNSYSRILIPITLLVLLQLMYDSLTGVYDTSRFDKEHVHKIDITYVGEDSYKQSRVNNKAVYQNFIKLHSF